jgi:hypothetical protein
MCNELLYCGQDHDSEVSVSKAPRPSGNPLDEYPGESGFNFGSLFGGGGGGGDGKTEIVHSADGDVSPTAQFGDGGKKPLMSKENIEGGIALAGMAAQGIKALSTEQGKACRAQCKSAGGLFSKARKDCKRRCKSGEMMGQQKQITPEPVKKTPWGLIIGGIVVLLVIVVVIVVVLRRKKAAA